MLFLTVVAVIGGSEGWEDIEDFGHCHVDLLRKYGDFSQGIPVHDTIARLISRIAPEQLQQAFIDWMKETEKLTKGKVIAVDAMGTQTEIAHTIVDKGADFLLAVKSNQDSLYQTVRAAFDSTEKRTGIIEKQKGRVEYREAFAADASSLLFDEKWPAIKTVGKIISYRLCQGKEQLQYRYYICSAALTAQELADAVRSHWAVENQLHWVLDVSLKEDECQIYRGHGAENLARLRQATVNILKREPSKLSIRRKRRRAAMDSLYLDKIINA